MSADNDSPEFDIDSFESVDEEELDNDGGRINLDSGEHLIGSITAANLAAGDHGLIEIDGRTLWLNATMRSQLESALIVGKPVAHAKSDEEESFEDDGEEVTFYPRELRFLSE